VSRSKSCSDTFYIDQSQIAEKIAQKTNAVMVVHLFGLCVDMNAINAFIPNNLRIKEGNYGWQSYLPTAIQKKRLHNPK
jgi:hypothetical protein